VDVAAEDVLHVGDDATLDALGALNAGMQAAWVNRSDHLWPHEQMPHVTITNLTELCELFE
jgi:FMN hydrolase / 5-amino-6-(5-phospho-D-ribitylamino)uracil phosphatase